MEPIFESPTVRVVPWPIPANSVDSAGPENTAVDLIIDRPPLNIFDLETLADLERGLDQLAASSSVRVVVVRGAGDRAFSAGVAIEDHTGDKIAPMLESFHGVCRKLMSLDALSIAAIQGHCLGGGMELAASCDIVFASDRARFGQPEIKLACFPPLAAALYPRRIGYGRTLDLLATGRIIDAAEAERIGFAQRLVPAEDLKSALESYVHELLATSTPALSILRRAVRLGAEEPFEPALEEAERLYVEDLAATHDMHEGVEAFLTKRAPRFKHA